MADYEAHLSGTLGDRPLAAAVIDRLVCAGATRGIVVDEDGKPVLVGSKVRNGTVRQRAAVDVRDGGRCRCCGSRWRAERHHILLWVLTRLTLVECLVSLCRRCHHDHHRGRFTITIDDGSGDFRFWTPDGEPLQRPSTFPGSPAGLVAANTSAGVVVDEQRCRSRWDGSRLETKWIPGPKDAPVRRGRVPRDVSDGFEVWNPADDDWHLDMTAADEADAQAEADARHFLATQDPDPTDHVPRDAIDDT